jgi:presenilin-like A22 family membrane protease
MASSAAPERAPDVIITHPNRDKPVVQGTRVTVVLLMLASCALLLIVTIGGWSLLQSAQPIQIGYILVYLALAYFAGRWNRGVLPVAAALAVLLAIFALVGGPSWFSRDKAGFAQAALNSSLLGLLTLLLVPLQMLLVAFAMRGFKQGWNVEIERRDPGAGADLYGPPAPYGGAPPHPA